ncbi:MAG: nucleotidyl transferase AbiEii/AbiGii toxin family protein [Solirubrobacteraceae bacterium]
MPPPERPALHAREIIRELNERGVEFVVIGGIAGVLHGSSRNTFDLDVCFATSEANLEALGAALTALGARLKGVEDDVPFVADARTLRHVEMLTLVTDLGELDVLAKPTGGPGFERLRSRAERWELDGVPVLVASIEDLLAMKRSAGRPKDLADVAELETIARLRRARA